MLLKTHPFSTELYARPMLVQLAAMRWLSSSALQDQIRYPTKVRRRKPKKPASIEKECTESGRKFPVIRTPLQSATVPQAPHDTLTLSRKACQSALS